MNAPYRELAAIPKTLKSEIELALEEGTRKREEYLESLQKKINEKQWACLKCLKSEGYLS